MREPNIAMEVRSLNNEAGTFVIYIEIKRSKNRELSRRMWEYYSLLSLRTKRNVLPMVLYIRKGACGITTETYRVFIFDMKILSFHYRTVGVGDLAAEDYLGKDNVLSAPISALMQGDNANWVLRKVRTYEKQWSVKLDDARKCLLFQMIDSYLPLNKAEESEKSKKMEERENTQVQEWHHIGL